MPIIRPSNVLRGGSDGAGDPCGPFRSLRFSDSGGLTQFGALVEILPPGSWSSVKHYHAHEDEMVYMLAGEVLLHEGASVSPLKAGEAATFRAGDPAGHCLQNAGDREARYLVIGTRSRTETVTYPDRDRVLQRNRDTGSETWTDMDGRPATPL